MVEKSELRLGKHVVVRLCGGETVGAVVDGLCNDWVGVRLDRGGYVIAHWEDIEVVRTEQGGGCRDVRPGQVQRGGRVMIDRIKKALYEWGKVIVQIRKKDE